MVNGHSTNLLHPDLRFKPLRRVKSVLQLTSSVIPFYFLGVQELYKTIEQYRLHGNISLLCFLTTLDLI